MDRISVLSTTELYADVSAKVAGVYLNPTAYPVQMALMLGAAQPSSGDWLNATWSTDPTTAPATYSAYTLIGPGGGKTLTAGTWTVWVKVTASPEIPAMTAGQIRAY